MYYIVDVTNVTIDVIILYKGGLLLRRAGVHLAENTTQCYTNFCTVYACTAQKKSTQSLIIFHVFLLLPTQQGLLLIIILYFICIFSLL